MPTTSYLARTTQRAFIAILIGIAARPFAQDVTASPAKQRAIEAHATFFRLESDAIRAAAGIARVPDVEDCVLQGAITAAHFVDRALCR